MSPTGRRSERVFCAFLPEDKLRMLRREMRSNPDFADEHERMRSTALCEVLCGERPPYPVGPNVR